MKNVICDICGTAYPSNAKKCPVCGSSREYALEDASVDTELDFLEEEAVSTPATPRKNKEIFDFDEVNPPKAAAKKSRPAPKVEDDFDDEEEEAEESSGTNVGLVVVLVILIVLLLVTAGFFFLRYLLPNMMPEETLPPTTVPVVTEAVETTVPGKPCTNLMMDGGKMELGKDGKKLLNVRIYPEDTTDMLTFVSGDETIVTVSEDGTVTAVGEGETIIPVTCGAQQINCNVTVDFTLGEETVPADTIPGMTVDPSYPTETTAATEETQAADAATEATDAAAPGEPKLKLKTSDITIGYRAASVPIALEGDLDPKDVEWASSDGSIAFVSEGNVISVSSGIARIIGEYGGEKVELIVRCIF